MRLLATFAAHVPAFLALFWTVPAAATPVSFTLSDVGSAEVTVRLLAYDSFDSVLLVNQDEVPLAGTADAELLGTLDPGFDVSRFSLAWGTLTYTGVIPNVGSFLLVLNPFEVHFTGDPLLNVGGRVKPTHPRSLVATSSTGGPTGSLTVAGVSASFDLGSLTCGSTCFQFGPYIAPALETTDLTNLRVLAASASSATQSWRQVVLTMGDVYFRVEVPGLWAAGAEYTLIPEPSTALLLAGGLAGLAFAGRPRKAL